MNTANPIMLVGWLSGLGGGEGGIRAHCTWTRHTWETALLQPASPSPPAFPAAIPCPTHPTTHLHIPSSCYSLTTPGCISPVTAPSPPPAPTHTPSCLPGCRWISDMVMWFIQQASLDLVLLPYSTEDEAGLHVALPPPMFQGVWGGGGGVSQGCTWHYHHPCSMFQGGGGGGGGEAGL